MWKNLSFALICLFWVTMNALLWHSELGPGHDLASSVPVQAVWEKILTSPDDSALSININDKKIGFMRWRPNVGEEEATGKIASENEPEGIVRKLTEYSVDIEGSFVADTIARAVRFNADLRFNPDLQWKRFQAQLILRPALWKIKGNAANRELWIEAEEDGTEWIRRFTFDELRDPQKLLSEIESPIVPLILAMSPAAPGVQMNLGLRWTARFDWLRIGQSRVRIYRLNAKLLDRHEITILITRVGEIVRVELPLGIRLINDTLFAS
jgi:hypothetical protein